VIIEKEREEIDRGRGRERWDLLVPLHDKSDTNQVVALAHFYVGG
jgi:hypothetical protein